MPVTNIRSSWSSGDLIFHESTSVAPSTTYNILKIADDAVQVGDTGNDIDFAVYGTGSVSFVIDIGAGTLTASGLDWDITGDVALTGDMAIDTGDVTIEDGYGLVVGDGSQETISNGDGSTDVVPEAQILGTAQADSTLMVAQFSATNASAPMIALVKSGDAAIDGTHAAVANDEYIGRIVGFGDDGTDLETPVAEIRMVVDDTGGPGTGAIGGSLEFYTTADGGSTLTKALTIDTAQDVTFVGQIIVDETTNSTSGTTGSIQTDGGLGVAKDIAAGDNLLFVSDGAIVSAVDGAGTTLLFKAGGQSGTTFITLTSQSAGTDTMELGAMTWGGAVSCGDQGMTGVGDMTFTDASIIAAVDGAATSLIFKAGGLSGTTFITLNSASGGTDSMVLGKAYFYDVGGESITSDGSNLTIDGNTIFPDTVYFYDAGGESISSNGSLLTVAGVTNFSDATDASAVGTAAVYLTGGLGVAKKVFIGDDVDLADGKKLIMRGATEYIYSSAASTVDIAANTTINLNAGTVSVDANATDLLVKANTDSALEFSDGTTAIVDVDTRNTVAAVKQFAFTSAASRTLPDAAAASFNLVALADFTETLAGTTQVTTAMDGLMLSIGTPTINQSGGAVIVDEASTVHIAAPPTAGASVTITAGYSLHVDSGNSRFDGDIFFNETSRIKTISKTIDHADLTDGTDATAYTDFDEAIPAGSIVIGVAIDFSEAFNSDDTTTLTLQIGDDGGSDPDQLNLTGSGENVFNTTTDVFWGESSCQNAVVTSSTTFRLLFTEDDDGTDIINSANAQGALTCKITYITP